VSRDRNQTRTGILNAVGRLLARSGFKEVGVNSIAREAGVDKVLIYRYFGGLPELLKAFAAETDFWPDLPELTQDTGRPGDQLSAAEQAKALVLAFGRSLRRRPLTQEIMRWELLERNELTDALARHREEQGAKLFESFDEGQEVDIRAIGSLLAAGQTYLILRSKTADVYNGLDLSSDEDWSRIERAASFLLDAALAPRGAKEMKPQAATRRTKRKK
jgi:AcrR family transcriptional regulator